PIPTTLAPAAPADPKALVRAVQTELARLGCLTAPPTGDWGPTTREAIERFNKRAPKAVVSTKDVADVDLSILRAVSAPLCPPQDGKVSDVEKNGQCITTAPATPALTRQEGPPLMGRGIGCNQIDPNLERLEKWIVDAQIRIGRSEPVQLR